MGIANIETIPFLHTTASPTTTTTASSDSPTTENTSDLPTTPTTSESPTTEETTREPSKLCVCGGEAGVLGRDASPSRLNPGNKQAV